MAREKQMEEFNMDDFNFEELAGDIFGDSVTTAKLDPSLQGKVILVYGANNTGKTKQAANLVKNSFIIPLERGTNAIGTKAQILRTSGWADAKKHARTLTTNKKLLAALRAGAQIGIIIDGLDNIPLLVKQYVCDQAGVDKFSQAGAHGAQWELYANEVFYFFNKLTSVGYTIIGIGHPYESGDGTGYLDLLNDKRAIKPIKDVADFTFYVESNGVDDEGKVIPSSAYLAEHKPTDTDFGFFARSRFPYVQLFFEEWDADIVKQAIHDGIVKQAEIEGAELVSFEEVVEKYESTFKLSYDEAIDKLYDLLDEADAKELGQDADDIILSHLDSVDAIKNLSKKQMQTIQSLIDELEHLLSEQE